MQIDVLTINCTLGNFLFENCVCFVFWAVCLLFLSKNISDNDLSLEVYNYTVYSEIIF